MEKYSRPEPAPELLELESLCGDWQSEDIHYPMPWMPDGGQGGSMNRFQKAVDGYCFLSDFSSETPFGQIISHSIWFYDNEKRKYIIQWYDNFGNHIHGLGDQLDYGFLFEMKYRMNGEDYVERHNINHITANAYQHSIEIRLDNERYRLTSELQYRRCVPELSEKSR